jgi:hypothetical protein
VKTTNLTGLSYITFYFNLEIKGFYVSANEEKSVKNKRYNNKTTHLPNTEYKKIAHPE